MARKMNDKLFWAIKTMLAGGAGVTETAGFFQIGQATVSRVKASENMTEYHNILAAIYSKKKGQAKPADKPEDKPVDVKEIPQAVELRETVMVRGTQYMEGELHKQTEALVLISNKLTATLEAVNALLERWS